MNEDVTTQRHKRHEAVKRAIKQTLLQQLTRDLEGTFNFSGLEFRWDEEIKLLVSANKIATVSDAQRAISTYFSDNDFDAPTIVSYMVDAMMTLYEVATNEQD